MILLSLAVVIWFSYPFAKLFECYINWNSSDLWTSLGPVKRYCKGVFDPDLSWIWDNKSNPAIYAANPFGVQSLWEGQYSVYRSER